jgi:phosphonate transport system substrate-binding protein
MKQNALCLLFIISFFTLLSCNRSENEITVDLSKRDPAHTVIENKPGNVINIAVGAMITPKEGFEYYRQLLHYIESKTGLPVKYNDRESYAEINDMLESGELDAAFVCSGPYVEGKDKFGLELLAMPVAYGETVYYSYIIVPVDSTAQSFDDLRGKRFAFTDPKSNTGKLVPTYMLSLMDETPESFFSEFNFTYAHDKSIRAVANGHFDGAAVDSLIWEFAHRKTPAITSRTRIIHKSPPYGIPPVAIRSGIDNSIKKAIKDVLLEMHKDQLGQIILQGMMIDRFVEPDDSAYDSVREMLRWTGRAHKVKVDEAK